jgi:hypothetical protein
MKKTIFSLLALLFLHNAAAQKLSIADVEVLPGSTVSFTMKVDVQSGVYSGFQFNMQFPTTGFSTTGSTTVSSSWQGGSLSVGDLTAGAGRGSALSLSDNPIPNGEIEIGTVEFRVDESVPLGEYDVTISDFNFLDGTNYTPVSSVTFKVHVVNMLTLVLDENSTTLPEAAEGVNVRVKQTIKAGEWSSICLPFAMTEAQVKAAFGNDVQLGNFCDTESTYDDENVTAISISFEDATEIEANHPYIIKVSQPITEFSVDNVDVDPAEDDALVEVDNGLTGRMRVVYGGFYGTYHAETTLEEYALFLNSNKFWYSMGLTKMKAFRAYFIMLDVLTDVENAAARISFSFDNKPTGINSLTPSQKGEGSVYYNLNGQRVKTLRQGLYIRDGKKMVIKEKGR